jgi:GAF domain-containing protein/HAMP domain-containing protein
VSTTYQDFEQGIEGMEKMPYFTALEAGTGDELNSAAAVEVQGVPGRSWKVAFMQPQTAFLQPIENQSRTAILLAIGVAAFVSLAVLVISRFIVHPLTMLTNIVETASTGDLTAQAPETGEDEIGTLAKSFNQMTTQLRQNMEGLELRGEERTAELAEVSEQMSYRASQLQTVSDVARAIATVQDQDRLLPLITKTISERFGYYHCGIFLLDPAGEYAVLQAANSEGGQRMLARGHRLRVGQVGIVGYVTDRGEPRIALDVGKDAVFFDNPDLPETRSEMALPLKVGAKVIGALDVQSVVSSAFKDEDISLLSTLADQMAIAIENARLFSETRQALTEAQTAQREYLRNEWEKVSAQQSLLGYQYTFGRITNLPQETDRSLWDVLDQGIELGYANQASADDQTGELASIKSEEGLVVPIKLRGQVIGLVGLQDVDQSRTWNEEEITLIQSVADQVGLALENARLLETTQRRAEREYLVGQITTKLRASNDPQTILQTAVTELRKALRANKAQVIVQSQTSSVGSLDTEAGVEQDPINPDSATDPDGKRGV